MSHRKGNDGAIHRQGRVLPLRESLIAAVMGSDYGLPPARREKVIYNGMNPVRDWTKAKHTDEVILEIRRLKEQLQMMPRKIVEHLSNLGVPATREDVIRILSYATRGHLVPDDGAAPYVTKATTQ